MRLSTDDANHTLTRFLPGSVKELGSITWPLVLSLLSMALMNFFNRFFLSHYSVEALEASISAMNLAFLFQIPCMRITSIAQVFVARFWGAKKLEGIGPAVWQMIWLSFLSMFITLPLGLGIGSLFFHGTVVEVIGYPYFSFLMFANFLFPLAGALGAFFIGLGQTKTITISLAIAHVIQICLDKILIFGIPGILDPQGAFGAAISTVVAQSLYCSILFYLFLQSKNRSVLQTGLWQIRITLFKECIFLGMPRAIGKLLILAAWAGSLAIITHRGGDYLLAFSLGISFYAFFSCLNEGLGQGLITVASYYMGGQQSQYLPRIARSSLVMLAGIISFLSLFLLFFPKLLITTFFPHALSPEQLYMLVYTCHGLWFFFICDGLSWIGFGFLNALKETKYYLLYTASTVLFFNYLPIYFAYQNSNWGVEMLWWIMSLPCLASAIAYFFRILKTLNVLKAKNLDIINEHAH
jgi:MATE family multidrug resistance protein